MAAKSILITGASSGIGAALARAYAAPGTILFLGGRDSARLEAVTNECAGLGARAESSIVDVTDADACARWIGASDDAAPLDLVIANAGIAVGIGTGAGPFEKEAERIRHMLDVNVGGTLNTIIPAIARMRPRRCGQIGIVSSLASFVGAPGAGAYCASKSAQRLLGEALRVELADDGIEVSVICPGFIRTPMIAENKHPMPFLMEADRAAAIIKRGLAADRGRIAFPLPMYWLIFLGACLPRALTEWGMRRFGPKG